MQSLEPILVFLKKLEKNNLKTWFDQHRADYETVKAIHLEWLGEILKGMQAINPALDQLQPKDCTYRINRDVRFSKDKRPYKNNFGAYINALGKKSETAGCYIHLQPGKSFIAAGMWMPSTQSLSRIRQEIDYNFTDFKKILQSSSMKKHFADGLKNNESLVRPPKGYTEDNAALEYLKLKSFVIQKPFNDEAVLHKNFNKEIWKAFETVKPYVDFLNAALH